MLNGLEIAVLDEQQVRKLVAFIEKATDRNDGPRKQFARMQKSEVFDIYSKGRACIEAWDASRSKSH